MSEREEREIISLLQDNLASVRKIAGWTVEDLGEKIGVTRQTISNLENKKTLMTRTQYIAICAVLQYEIPSNKNKEVLMDVINILVNNVESYSNEEKNKIGKSIRFLASLSADGGEKDDLIEASEKLGIASIATNIADSKAFIESGTGDIFIPNKQTKGEKKSTVSGAGVAIGIAAASVPGMRVALGVGSSLAALTMSPVWLSSILKSKKKEKKKK